MMRAPLASIPATLGGTDAGFLFFATDYEHTYRWSGSTWNYAPGDDGSGYYREWSEAPTFGLWQICDGSATTRSTSAGGTAAVTVPNLTASPAFLQSNTLAALTGIPVAASAPTVTGPANTGSTAPGISGSTATNTVTISGSSGGTAVTISGSTANESAHTHSIDPPLDTTGNNTTAIEVQAGTGEIVANDPHIHNVNLSAFTSGAGSAHLHAAGTLAGDSHTHAAGTLAGDAHDHGIGTIAVNSHVHTIGAITASSTGLPRHLDVAVYYRL